MHSIKFVRYFCSKINVHIPYEPICDQAQLSKFLDDHQIWKNIKTKDHITKFIEYQSIDNLVSYNIFSHLSAKISHNLNNHVYLGNKHDEWYYAINDINRSLFDTLNPDILKQIGAKSKELDFMYANCFMVQMAIEFKKILNELTCKSYKKNRNFIIADVTFGLDRKNRLINQISFLKYGYIDFTKVVNSKFLPILESKNISHIPIQYISAIKNQQSVIEKINLNKLINDTFPKFLVDEIDNDGFDIVCDRLRMLEKIQRHMNRKTKLIM